MTAKETLDVFRARAQFIITMSSLAIYVVCVLVFLLIMHRIQADQRLTIAVLLLTPLPGLINSAGAFWLNRSRDDGAEKPPTITASAGAGGASASAGAPAGSAASAPWENYALTAPTSELPVDMIEDGYRFKGGNPADSANWEKVP